MYTYMYVDRYRCIYIYIYIERERDYIYLHMRLRRHRDGVGLRGNRSTGFSIIVQIITGFNELAVFKEITGFR